MADKKTELAVYDAIRTIARRIGMREDTEKTVFEISDTQDPSQKTLTLKSGSWDGAEPWFAVDSKQKLYTLVSIESMNKMVDSLRNTQQENFNLKLEKTIWQHIPVDFQDVWAVAMDEIRRIASKSNGAKAINVDLDRLVGNIKKTHPNLFVDLKDLMLTRPQKG